MSLACCRERVQSLSYGEFRSADAVNELLLSQPIFEAHVRELLRGSKLSLGTQLHVNWISASITLELHAPRESLVNPNYDILYDIDDHTSLSLVRRHDHDLDDRQDVGHDHPILPTADDVHQLGFAAYDAELRRVLATMRESLVGCSSDSAYTFRRPRGMLLHGPPGVGKVMHIAQDHHHSMTLSVIILSPPLSHSNIAIHFICADAAAWRTPAAHSQSSD